MLSALLAEVRDRAVRQALDRVLAGRDATMADVLALEEARGGDLHALLRVADALREEQVGQVGTYVVNRNINFTNVCVKACRFCAYARGLRSEQAYRMPVGEVARRAREAAELGATELCIQAGLAPDLDLDAYLELVAAVREAAPHLHLHAFSPEEVLHAARRSGCPVREVLVRFRDAGVGSLPGTAAEILDDEVRRRIAPGRLAADEWEAVVRAAHEVGLPTTATMMFGHVETPAHRAAHLLRIRAIQRETGGFTEFVPLPFVHREAPLAGLRAVPGVRPGPTGDELVRVFAIARIVLGRDLPHLQASWVKEGLRMAQWLLHAGADDLGGTLLNESISTQAGSPHGQFARPAELRAAIRAAGRRPVERDTRYRPLPDRVPHPLDAVDPARFGSYEALARDPRMAWRPPGRARRGQVGGEVDVGGESGAVEREHP